MKGDRFRRTLQGDAEIDKVPDEEAAYSVDWNKQLDTGEGIAQSEWTALPAGLALQSPGVSGTIATVRIAGGVAGTTYVVTNTITKTGSQEVIPRSFLLHVRQHLS